MVGFALIIIIVAVIMLIFLSLSLKNPTQTNVKSGEIDNFILGSLQYTTDCKTNQLFLNLRALVFECYTQAGEDDKCLDGRSYCQVLNTSLSKILENSWSVKTGSKYKGYALNINANENTILNITQGSPGVNYKESSQDFSRGGNNFIISFRVYED